MLVSGKVPYMDPMGEQTPQKKTTAKDGGAISPGFGCDQKAFQMTEMVIWSHVWCDDKGRPLKKKAIIDMYVMYVPGTQVTLMFIGNGLVL